MIGKIQGIFAGYYGNTAIIDVCVSDISSVGYEVSMKQDDILSLSIGDVVCVFIKEIITEDNDVLYGFLSFEDKCWFEEFVKLSGLGPKTALAILSTYSCEAITDAIMINDCDFFSAISGIGAKIANRIPTEMKKQISKINEKVITFGKYAVAGNYIQQCDKVDAVKTLLQIDDNENNNDKNALSTKTNHIKSASRNANKKNEQDTSIDKKRNKSKTINDAVEALVALGFSKQIVYNDVFGIVKENDLLSVEDIVKKFLQKINK
ncbi:MAG: hypothetical protein IJT15_01990 [Rickettsiales bacterium]|nr:hypothetical protein [Rickettsiales bacterium]